MTEKSNQERAANAIGDLLRQLIPVEHVKDAVSADKGFMDTLVDNVVERLVEEGLIEDRLLSGNQTMKILGIKSRSTLYKLNQKGLTPIRPEPNAHPKYRMSDITRFIRTRKKVRYSTAS